MLREKHNQNYHITDEHTTRLYGIWHGINQRCYNPKSVNYPRYGARGVQVCDLWRRTNPYGFACFVSWALQNGYSDTLSIDRIDSNGDYTPTNCRWADRTTQNRNKANSKPIMINGVQYASLAECCEALGRTEDYDTILLRINNYGYTPERAFTEPIREPCKPITIDGTQYKNIKECCEAYGLNYKTVRAYKCKRHTTYEEAVLHYIDM